MIHFLEILVSIVFFANKVFVLAEKKVGWLVGVIAAILAFVYFWQIDLYVFTVLELGLIVLMGYGFFKKDQTNETVESVLKILMVLVMLLLTIFTFSDMMTVTEFLASISLLLGTHLLTHGRMRLGWMIYVIAHTLAAIVGYSKEQFMFCDFQIASAIVAIVGVMKK